MSWYGTIKGRVGKYIQRAAVNNPPLNLAAAVSALLSSAWVPAQGVAQPAPKAPIIAAIPAGNPLGAGLNGVTYYSPELPFLNIMKAASGSVGTVSVTPNGRFVSLWRTSSSSVGDTNEEAYLNVDNDGYATSLVASPAPPGGQVFTKIQCFMNLNVGGSTTPPGQTYTYPPGSYTLTFTGTGTVVIGGGDTSAGNGSGANGLTFTNTGTGTYTGTFTVTPSYGGGINLQITAMTTDGVNYVRNMSVVLTANQAAYAAGAIFNPTFLNAISHFKCLRFMDWMNTNDSIQGIYFSGAIAAGATSAPLSSNWFFPSGTYNFTFKSSGQIVACTLSANAKTCHFGTPLSGACPAGQTALFATLVNYAQRPLATNATYNDFNGVPLEICLALANTLNVNPWINIPAGASDAFITSTASTIHSTLNSNLTAYIEYSNEVWNGQFAQAQWSLYTAQALFGADGGQDYNWQLSWYGVRVAQTAQLFYNVYGASDYASRLVISMGAQAGSGNGSSNFTLSEAMGAPPWVALGNTAPSAQAPAKITACHIAPYFGVGGGFGAQLQADLATMASKSDGGLSDFFAEQTSYTGKYTSTPAGGYVAETIGWTTATIAQAATYGIPVNFYESGSQWGANGQWAPGSAVYNLINVNSARDARMGALYNTYYTAHRNAGASLMNIFVDISAIQPSGAFGALESIMQLTDGSGNAVPLASLPAKWQALQNYMGYTS